MKTGAGAKPNGQKQKNKSKGQKKIKEDAKSFLEKNMETQFEISTTHSSE